MAEQMPGLGKQLVAEITCPLCLDLLAQPVLTACGHSFCKRCLAAVLGQPERPAACPQCRAAVEPGSLRPNHSLGSVAELARALEQAAGRPRCPRHGEPLALFCEPCGAPVCALCRDGSEHRQHRVRAPEEAAGELREILKNNLLFLQKQREKLKLEGDQQSLDLMRTVKLELQRVAEAFAELQQFLKEEKNILMSELIHVSQLLFERRYEHSCRLWEIESLLDTVMEQLKKRDQPMAEFLLNVGRILSRCEAAKAPIPELVSPELQKSVESLSEVIQLVLDVMAKFKAYLQSKIDRKTDLVMPAPATVSPHPGLSQDHNVTRHEGGIQNFPDASRRFMTNLSILGSQGFVSGRHYWEVDVGQVDVWTVGVALESVLSKDFFSLVRSGKIWALQLDEDGQYKIVHVSRVLLTVKEKLQRLRIYLDYEAGRVTFYNARNMLEILQFDTTFTEKVFPYFSTLSGDIRLCG